MGPEDRLHVVGVGLLAFLEGGDGVLVGADLGDLRLALFLLRVERGIARDSLVLGLLDEDRIALVVLHDGLGLEDRAGSRSGRPAVRLRLRAPALELGSRTALG